MCKSDCFVYGFLVFVSSFVFVYLKSDVQFEVVNRFDFTKTTNSFIDLFAVYFISVFVIILVSGFIGSLVLTLNINKWVRFSLMAFIYVFSWLMCVDFFTQKMQNSKLSWEPLKSIVDYSSNGSLVSLLLLLLISLLIYIIYLCTRQFSA